MKIVYTTTPRESIIPRALPRIDYQDAYQCRFSSSKDLSPDDFFKGLFLTMPAWVTVLFKIRERVAGFIGLKVAQKLDRHEIENFVAEKGASLGLFKVLDRNEQEIITGEDDKHLDFRLSFYLEKSPWNGVNEYTLVLTTIVMFRRQLGKLYFIPVKPFHKWIVPAVMRKMVSTLA